MIVVWIFFIIFALLLIGSMALGVLLTRRAYLVDTHTPAEVGLNFEEITFPAADGLLLSGWWVPAPVEKQRSQRVIIQMHGHGGSMDPDIQYLPAWHGAGYNVLLFDFRGHGRSQGNAITFGYLERRDVQGAIRYIKDNKGLQHIALVGFSLGGMVAITSAPICPEVGAVVEDGAPIRIWSAASVWAVEHKLPIFLGKILAWMAVLGASLRIGANLFQYEPVRWAGRIYPRPLMIIHGELDQYLPDFQDLLKAVQPDELWRLPGVGHTQVSVVYPHEYRQRIIAFLDRYLPGI
jgi:fermentation-respiration switch protein FrsA (DUF1100 family)